MPIRSENSTILALFCDCDFSFAENESAPEFDRPGG